MTRIFTYLLASAVFCLTGTMNAMADEGTDLTAAMFKNYEDPANPKDVNCTYTVGEQTGMPYGDGNVDYLNYADITEYDFLVVTVTSKKDEGAFPRPFVNRTEPGQQAGDEFDKNLPIDFNKEWARTRYMTELGDAANGWTYTFDVKKMVADYGFAHLHCIKVGAWSELTVSAMKLYKGEIPSGISSATAVTTGETQLYNAAGQKVGKNYKGLVIQKNGKKWIQR